MLGILIYTAANDDTTRFFEFNVFYTQQALH